MKISGLFPLLFLFAAAISCDRVWNPESCSVEGSGLSFTVQSELDAADTKLRVIPTEENRMVLRWKQDSWCKVWPSPDSKAALIFSVSEVDALTGITKFSFLKTGDPTAPDKFSASGEMYLFNSGNYGSNGANPFDADSKDASYSANHQKISAEQKAWEGSVDHESIPYGAHWKGSEAGKPFFQVKFFFSLLKIHIDVDLETVLEKIVLTNGAIPDASLCAEYYWKIGEDGVPEMKLVSTGSSSITVSPVNKQIKSGDYYIAVRPECTIRNPKITFHYSDGTTDEFTNSAIEINPEDIPRLKVLDIGSFSLPKGERHRYTVKESAGWIASDNNKDVTAGSAMDMTQLGLLDAPAGKYGWLRNVDGHFEFENRPGKPVRFYGNNLCSSANYPSHELADAFIERAARMGYNTLRIHHHDTGFHEKSEKLDYMLYKAVQKGIYITTDMYVSRKVRYSDVGLEGEGEMSISLFKLLVACYEPAFQNWCAFASEFMNHVNPYTGRAYKDEPALCLISLVNEPLLKNGWNDTDKRDCKPLLDCWHEYGGEGDLPAVDSDEFNAFISYLHKRQYEKCSAYMRELGCKALLTNDNDGQCRWEGKGAMPLYDYVDTHHYVDLPGWPVGQYVLPCTSSCLNPLTNEPSYIQKTKPQGYTRPWTASEWNHCAPSPYRAMGCTWGSARLAADGLDGLWRFAYAHGDTGLENKETPRGYTYLYNTHQDLMQRATEPAVVSFFLRGDVTSSDQITVGQDGASMSVGTEKSAAVYAGSGKVSAGMLSATIMDSPAVVFATALDGKALEASGRILLSHLTDSHSDGEVFGSAAFTRTYSFGSGVVVKAGRAEVSLALPSPSEYSVYALDCSGKRIGRIGVTQNENGLTFTASVAGKEGARLYYEINRDGGFAGSGSEAFGEEDVAGNNQWE